MKIQLKENRLIVCTTKWVNDDKCYISFLLLFFFLISHSILFQQSNKLKWINLMGLLVFFSSHVFCTTMWISMHKIVEWKTTHKKKKNVIAFGKWKIIVAWSKGKIFQYTCSIVVAWNNQARVKLSTKRIESFSMTWRHSKSLVQYKSRQKKRPAFSKWNSSHVSSTYIYIYTYIVDNASIEVY